MINVKLTQALNSLQVILASLVRELRNTKFAGIWVARTINQIQVHIVTTFD